MRNVISASEFNPKFAKMMFRKIDAQYTGKSLLLFYFLKKIIIFFTVSWFNFSEYFMQHTQGTPNLDPSVV